MFFKYGIENQFENERRLSHRFLISNVIIIVFKITILSTLLLDPLTPPHPPPPPHPLAQL